MNEWRAVKGSAWSYDVRVRGEDGEPIPAGQFSGLETLECEVWPGDDLPTLLTVEPTWIDPDAALINVSFAADAWDDIPSGVYQVEINNTAEEQLLYRGVVRVLDAPGSGVALKAYCTYGHLIDEIPWIDQLFDPEKDQYGFTEQRAKARSWLDEIILQQTPSRTGGFVSTQTYWDWPVGSSGYDSNLGYDSTIKDYLDDDKLILTDRLVEACTCYALNRILDRAAGQNRQSTYLDMAAKYRKRASYLVATAIAQIDTNDDGKCDIAIPLNVTNTRYG